MAYDSPKLAHSIKQQEVVIPDLSIKELLDAIPWVAAGVVACWQKSDEKFQGPLLQTQRMAVISLRVRFRSIPNSPFSNFRF